MSALRGILPIGGIAHESFMDMIWCKSRADRIVGMKEGLILGNYQNPEVRGFYVYGHY